MQFDPAERTRTILRIDPVYLVRDALTGRVLTAEQMTSSETAGMKALPASVLAPGVKVLGTITDAQESEL